MELIVEKVLDGSLRPATEHDAELLTQIKSGQGVRVKLVRIRNYAFLKKTFALFKVAYEHFCEYGVGQLEYKGRKVTPSFDRFRKDLIILAGHYEPVFDIRGNLRLEAHSLSYANCSEEKANEIYQSLITAALANVYMGRLNEVQLNDLVGKILHFA